MKRTIINYILVIHYVLPFRHQSGWPLMDEIICNYHADSHEMNMWMKKESAKEDTTRRVGRMNRTINKNNSK